MTLDSLVSDILKTRIAEKDTNFQDDSLHLKNLVEW